MITCGPTAGISISGSKGSTCGALGENEGDAGWAGGTTRVALGGGEHRTSTCSGQYGEVDNMLGLGELGLSSDTASMSCCSFISAVIIVSATAARRLR